MSRGDTSADVITSVGARVCFLLRAVKPRSLLLLMQLSREALPLVEGPPLDRGMCQDDRRIDESRSEID